MYTITLGGQGADPDDVKEIFENAVRALRAVTDGASLEAADGSLYATDAGFAGTPTQTIQLAARDVEDLDEAPDPDELPHDAAGPDDDEPG